MSKKPLSADDKAWLAIDTMLTSIDKQRKEKLDRIEVGSTIRLVSSLSYSEECPCCQSEIEKVIEIGSVLTITSKENGYIGIKNYYLNETIDIDDIEFEVMTNQSEG